VMWSKILESAARGDNWFGPPAYNKSFNIFVQISFYY
jgi:hypothetical protein